MSSSRSALSSPGLWRWGSAQLGVRRCYLPGAGRWRGPPARVLRGRSFSLLSLGAQPPSSRPLSHSLASGAAQGALGAAPSGGGPGEERESLGSSRPDSIGGSLPEETGGLGRGAGVGGAGSLQRARSGATLGPQGRQGPGQAFRGREPGLGARVTALQAWEAPPSRRRSGRLQWGARASRPGGSDRAVRETQAPGKTENRPSRGGA